MQKTIENLLPVLIGAVLAYLVAFGYVWSVTQPPEFNPATQPVLTYGS